MSRKKNVPSWRIGKSLWRVRLYIDQETKKAVRQQALNEERDVAFVLLKAIEKFVSEEGGTV